MILGAHIQLTSVRGPKIETGLHTLLFFREGEDMDSDTWFFLARGALWAKPLGPEGLFAIGGPGQGDRFKIYS